MKIAIHNSSSGFHPRWEAYCQEQNIPYKRVDCYANDIVQQLSDCNALMWHFHQSNSKAILVARQILFALEHSGLKIFPDFKTAWHFDDKVGQKYLLEAMSIPMVASYVFLEKEEAVDWVNQTDFPKVFKLRGGAGSANVRLVRNRKEGKKLIQKAFGKGFKQYEAWTNLRERWRKYSQGKTNLYNVLKGVVRLGYEPDYSKTIGKERGYVYFQDFIANNNFDIRIIVVDHKAFGLKRYVRENDFRASGSGDMAYSKEEFDERCVEIAFEAAEKLHSQSLALDFVFDQHNLPLIVEISFGFIKEVYDACPGYWDNDLNWHEGKFNPQNWMIESLIKNRSFEK